MDGLNGAAGIAVFDASCGKAIAFAFQHQLLHLHPGDNGQVRPQFRAVFKVGVKRARSLAAPGVGLHQRGNPAGIEAPRPVVIPFGKGIRRFLKPSPPLPGSPVFIQSV